MTTNSYLRRVGAFTCAVALLGCGETPVAEPEPNVCIQAGEFANYGCAAVSGRVVGSLGQPLPGMSVGARHLTSQNLNHGPVSTDWNGRFQLTVTRYHAPPAAGVPDTLSFYVHALDLASVHNNSPEPIQDSAFVQVRLVPVGEVPAKIEVELRLPRQP